MLYKESIVEVMSKIYNNCMTTASGGNLSIKASDGSIWITPSGKDKGTITAADIVHILPNGEIQGDYRPSIEFPVHKKIYEQRPDLQAILHAHPPGLIAVSLTHNIVNTAILPFFREYCGPVGMARYALPGSKELSENISAVFAQGYTNVMLENHGIIMGGDSLEEIYKRFEILELCANVMIDTAFLASGVSVKADKSESYHDFFKVNTGESNQLNKEFIQERKNLLQYVSRVHQKKLSPSAFFSISSVLEGNRMLILNPSPGYAAEQSDNFSVIDISTAAQTDENGLSALHKAIYAKNKNIGCIMLATPPSIMAFACSKFVFNPHVIPEAYMVLRQVKTLQHGLIRSPERIAGEITGRSDVFIVKNGFVMICAKDPIKAYDRLEVLEFSARALIDAKRLGVVHYIQDSDIKKLENAFTL